jgi:hypothetical protein
MARPQKRKAAKDYPGIPKGSEYWYVKIKTGPRSSRVMRQLTAFKRSQLTSSEFLSAQYAWEETKAELSDMDEAQGLADTIRELGEEQQSKKDNMPDGLQQGDTGQLLEDRATACEDAATEIEAVISDWESAKDDYETEQTAFEEYETALENWISDGEPEGDKPEEVEDPGEFDEDEYISRVQDVEINI